MQPSQRFTLNQTDVQKWIHNAEVFLAPVALLYVSFVLKNINSSGFSWSVFYPTVMVQGSFVLYVLNTVYDLLTKFIQGN